MKRITKNTTFSHQPPPSLHPAPAAAAAAGPRFKVALLGASGGIGQPLGLLLKL